MNFIEKALVRKVLKPQLVNVGEEHVELKFDQFDLIRRHAGSYLHYLEDVMTYLPGVLTAELNEQDGTLSIQYDGTRTDSRKVSKWFDYAVESGIKASDEINLMTAEPDQVVGVIKKHLLPLVSEF